MAIIFFKVHNDEIKALEQKISVLKIYNRHLRRYKQDNLKEKIFEDMENLENFINNDLLDKLNSIENQPQDYESSISIEDKRKRIKELKQYIRQYLEIVARL